jgi:hypothetical protein
MSNTWITHLPHFLDEAGNLPQELPAPALKMANAMCSFVVYATNFAGEMDEEFPPCFVAIDNKVCYGKVFPCLAIDEKIAWQCNTCGSNGTISGWHGTLWDLSNCEELQ